MFSKNNKDFISDIKTRTISKNFTNYNGEKIKVSIIDAKYGVHRGNEILLDEPLVNNMLDNIVKVIDKNNSKYNKVPRSLVISYDKDLLGLIKRDESEKKLDEECNYNNEKTEIVDIYEPRYDFESVYIKEDSKNQILGGLTILKNKEKLFNEWGLANSMKSSRALIFNFYGPPGTGKSMTAEAIAKYLNKKVFSVNYSQLESKYVGETPKNIKRVFSKAKEEDAIIIFDEADSFLGKRLTNITQSADYGVNITRSVMLMELENFDGVVIFTTNLLDNYDDAFKRRILANVEFDLPDEIGRLKIWNTHIPKEFPLNKDITLSLLASRYEKISGADIKDIVLFAGVNAIQNNREFILKEDFDLAYKYIIDRYKKTSRVFNDIKVKTTRISEEEYQKEIEMEEK
ncbi:AAA family ATPase [Clostridium perfringens]|uniref:ATP-binding protein n=1 Tax=Clostridium perfringens TaxID=1502 RepID=UPI00163D42B9|nr:AAA family ATPase [Clostridium perfringens]MDK0917009.1 AAA family ATPase [Clostridium perfringens]UBK78252.1 AAA family ATPase [Clostridium perfringens]